MNIRAKPKKLTRRIAIAVAAAMISTSIVPSVSLAEELQISDETKQNLIDIVADQTSENEVAVTDSVEQLNEVVPNEELVSSTSTSLIINSTDDMTFSDETIVSVVKYNEYYVVTYDTAESAKIAFDTFTSQGIAVEYNNSIDKPEDVKEEELDKVENTSDEVKSTEADTEKKTITVAVLDTGIADVSDDELLKDMVLEGYSVIDDSVYDNNGHGTVMANIIASSFKDTEMFSDTEIKILPVKVLDENGNGSVLSVYMGMEYALAHDADVINLSISGLGNSNILTNEINKAYNQGVTTVVAAGNNSDDVANYIPGNIDTAITVSAIAERDNEKVFAEYSNHGSFVDFSAMGTYEITYTDEAGEEIVTSVNGTSVASAYVTSCVAMLKALGREDVSETDVYASLQASVEDLGEVGYDEYFGFGYLEKENIKEIKEHTTDNEKDVDLEENEDDSDQELNTSGGWYGDYWMATSEADIFVGAMSGATKFLLMNDITYINTWVVNGGNYLLDLGGHTIYTDPQKLYAYALNDLIKVNAGGAITLQNGTIDGRGWCYSSVNDSRIGSLITIYPAGTLVMNNITIGNVTNKVDYDASADEGGGTIVNNWGTLVANNTCFHDCSGTAIWLADSYNSAYGNGTGTTLNNCSSYNVSGLYSSGPNRGIATTLTINGGNYKCGRAGHYFAGIEAANAVNATIKNCNFAGHINIFDHSFLNMDNVYIEGNNRSDPNQTFYNAISLRTDKNSTIKNTTITHTLGGMAIEAFTPNVTNEVKNTVIKDCLFYGINNENNIGGTINCSDLTIDNCGDGICNKNSNSTIKICGTTSIHNCFDKGILNESGTVTIDRNAAINIYKNQTGIWNQATCNIYGGSYWNGHDTIGGIRSNTGQGIVNYGTLILSPDPANNKRIDIAQNGYNGIYNEGVVNDYGAYIWSNTHAGVVNGADGTTNPTYNKTSGNFNNNEHEGLVNRGTAKISNSNIYNNGSNGVANHKTATIKNSAIYNNGIKSGWAVAGVYNGSNITLENDTIRNNRFINAWNNIGTMTINGGSYINEADNPKDDKDQDTNFGLWNNDTVTIKGGTFSGYNTDVDLDLNDGIPDHGASCVWNNGTANISGGEFKDSHYGLVNCFTLNQSGGSSNNNSVYDVYQSGDYNVSGSAVAQKVFLTRGHIINNTNVLDNSSTGSNRFTIFVEDKSVGRNVVKAWTGWDANYANGHFVNGDESVSDASAVSKSAAIHRVSDLTNAPVDGYDNRGDDMYVNNHYGNTAEGSKYLVLTAEYKLDYDPYKNVDRNIYYIDEKQQGYSQDQRLYWNEAGDEHHQPFKYDQRPVIYFN